MVPMCCRLARPVVHEVRAQGPAQAKQTSSQAATETRRYLFEQDAMLPPDSNERKVRPAEATLSTAVRRLALPATGRLSQVYACVVLAGKHVSVEEVTTCCMVLAS